MAKCLGAKTVAARALECTKELEILSEVVDDAQAVSAVQKFLGEWARPPSPGSETREAPASPRDSVLSLVCILRAYRGAGQQ